MSAKNVASSGSSTATASAAYPSPLSFATVHEHRLWTLLRNFGNHLTPTNYWWEKKTNPMQSAMQMSDSEWNKACQQNSSLLEIFYKANQLGLSKADRRIIEAYPDGDRHNLFVTAGRIRLYTAGHRAFIVFDSDFYSDNDAVEFLRPANAPAPKEDIEEIHDVHVGFATNDWSGLAYTPDISTMPFFSLTDASDIDSYRRG